MENPQLCPSGRVGPLNQSLDSFPFLTSFRVKAADLHPWPYTAPLHLLFLTSVKRRLGCRKEHHLPGGIVSGSLVRRSGFSFLAAVFLHFRIKPAGFLQPECPAGDTCAIQSPPTGAVATGMLHLVWHPLTKTPERHSQQVRTKTEVQNSRGTDRSRNSSGDRVPCFPRGGRKQRGSCCPLSPEAERCSLPNNG